MLNGTYIQETSITNGSEMGKMMTLRFLQVAAIFGMASCVGNSMALDNPDAPRYLDDFTRRAESYELKIRQSEGSTRDYGSVYVAYETFLDNELNTVYSLLNKHLNGKSRATLQKSQRDWLKFRDSEFEFISVNWINENFGTSSIISRGDYRTTLIKQRVTSLLYYLQNYSR